MENAREYEQWNCLGNFLERQVADVKSTIIIIRVGLFKKKV